MPLPQRPDMGGWRIGRGGGAHGRRSAVALAAALAALALAAALPAPPAALADSHGVPAVDPAAPRLVAAGSLSLYADGQPLGRLGDVDAFVVNGSVYAAATSITRDAVHLLRIHDNGTMSLAGQAIHGRGYDRLDGAYGIDTFVMNGTAYAIVASYYGGGGAQLIRIHGNGTMEPAGSLADGNSGIRLNGATRIDAFFMNGTAYALAAAFEDSGAQLIRIHGNGSLSAEDALANNNARELDQAFGVAVFDLDDGPHALVSGYRDDGVELIRIHGNATLEGRDRMTDGSGRNLNGASGVAAFEMNGTVHALVALDDGDGAQLIRIHGNGTMEPAGFLGDNYNERELGGANDAVSFETSTGARYGLVASATDDGIQLMRIHVNGTMEPEGSANNNAAGFDGLADAFGLDTFDLDGRAHAIVVTNFGYSVQLVEMPPVAAVRVNSTAAGDFYAEGSMIDIDVTFDSPVRVEGPLGMRLNTGGSARYDSGSGTDTLTFLYTVGPGEAAGDLDYAGIHALSVGGNVTHVATGLPAGRALPSPGYGMSLGDLRDIAVDARGPTAASASVDSGDGVHGAGARLNVTVSFDEAVVYSGDPPALALDVGGEARVASYASGNGTDTLVFNYTVRAGDYEDDLDYLGTGALSGNVTDLRGNPANLTLPRPGSPGSMSALHDVTLDHAAPRLIAGAHAGDGQTGHNAGTTPYDALGQATDADAIASSGGTFAVVSAQEGAVQLIRVHENGTMEAEYSVHDPAASLANNNAPAAARSVIDGLDQPFGVEAFRMGGASHAIVSAHGDGGDIRMLRIHGGSGTLSPAGLLNDSGTLELAGATKARVFEMGDSLHALVAGFGDDGVQLVNITGAGLVPAGSLNDTDAAGLVLDGPYDLDVFDLGGGERHALVSGYDDHGVQLVRIHGNGTLEAAGQLPDNGTLALRGPRGVAAFDLGGGERHALVSSQAEGGIQLIRMRDGGTLEPVASATDGAGGFDELSGAFDIAEIGGGSPGGVYAAVAASGDDGVQLVRVRADGALLPAGSATDGDPGFEELDGAHGIAAFGSGGGSHVLVAARGDDGVQLIRTSTASVANVTTGAGEGPHAPGSVIDIRVAFDGGVTAAGPLELRLNTGGVARHVPGGGALVFRYVVADGDREVAALEYDGVHALRAGPGGSITEDSTGLPANALLPPPGSQGSLGGSSSIAIDRPPSVVSVSSPNATGTYGIGEAIHLAVNFTERVTVTGSPLLGLGTGGSAEYRSGSGSASLLFEYTVEEGDVSPDLDYANTTALSLNGGTIENAAGSAAILALPAPGSDGLLAGAPRLEVDGVRPEIVSVSSPDGAGTYGIGETIRIAVNFTERVAVEGAPLIGLETGEADRDARYASGSGSASLLFEYTVEEGDVSPDLGYANRTSLSLNGGAIEDRAGNAANLALPVQGGGDSLAESSAIAVDGARLAGAAAAAVFTGPNTVRIDYTAPLGPPAGHAGPAYGGVTVDGGAGEAPVVSVSGLGTRTHIVRFGGDGVDDSRTGSIRLLVGLAGEDGGVPRAFPAGSIPVGTGSGARTLSPPGDSPVAAIERNGFVRALNATAAGGGARLAINVSGLADAATGTVAFPSERVAMAASFASVWFPPNATAAPVPADGLLVLYVSRDAPDARDVAAALGLAAPGLDVRRIVEVGDNSTHIWFNLPVRILLAGQANGSAFYVNTTSGAVVPIAAACGEDDTAAVHEQLGGSGACQIDSGADKVVYTYHLARFGTAGAGAGAPGGAETCAASLEPTELAFGSVEAGAQSAEADQAVRAAGTLPLAGVSVGASAWLDADGGIAMPANATSVLDGGGAWVRLGGGDVDLPAADTPPFSAKFRLDVPLDALPEGASSVRASQSVEYTVTCGGPPG